VLNYRPPTTAAPRRRHVKELVMGDIFARRQPTPIMWEKDEGVQRRQKPCACRPQWASPRRWFYPNPPECVPDHGGPLSKARPAVAASYGGHLRATANNERIDKARKLPGTQSGSSIEIARTSGIPQVEIFHFQRLAPMQPQVSARLDARPSPGSSLRGTAPHGSSK